MHGLFTMLCFQSFFQFFDERITKLSCLGFSTQVASTQATSTYLLIIKNLPYSKFNSSSFSMQSKWVAKEKCCREDCTNWVSDSLTSDIRGLSLISLSWHFNEVLTLPPIGSCKPNVFFSLFGTALKDDDGSRPKAPGMTEASSERLIGILANV